MCSPTGIVVDGRNHHRVGNEQIAELANDGKATPVRSPRAVRWWLRCAPLRVFHGGVGEVAQHTGGADHAAGPFDNWPTGWVFSISTGSWPGRRRSRAEPGPQHHHVLPPRTPEQGYHLSEDLADDAIGWLRHTGRRAGQAVLHVLGQRLLHVTETKPEEELPTSRIVGSVQQGAASATQKSPSPSESVQPTGPAYQPRSMPSSAGISGTAMANGSPPGGRRVKQPRQLDGAQWGGASCARMGVAGAGCRHFTTTGSSSLHTHTRAAAGSSRSAA